MNAPSDFTGGTDRIRERVRPKPDRHPLDLQDLRAGNQSDEAALSAYLLLPGATDELHAYLHRNGERHAEERTRGPRFEALRVLANERTDAHEVRRHLAIADRHYWAVVLRHDGFVRTTSIRAKRKVAPTTEDEDVLTLGRLGAFAAALRHADDGIRFPTYAVAWIQTKIQRGRDVEGGVKVSLRGIKAVQRAIRLNNPAFDDGEETLLDQLAAPDDDPSDRLDEPRVADKLKALLLDLPERERSLFLRHALDDASYSALGSSVNLSRERVRQIVQHAIRRAKAHAETDPDLASAAGRTPKKPEDSRMEETDRTQLARTMEARDARILSDLDAGDSFSDVARRYGISRGRVGQIRAKARIIPVNSPASAHRKEHEPPAEGAVDRTTEEAVPAREVVSVEGVTTAEPVERPVPVIDDVPGAVPKEGVAPRTKEERNALILRELSAGVPMMRIAKKVGVSPTRIHQIKTASIGETRRVGRPALPLSDQTRGLILQSPKSARELGEEIGMSRSRVCRIRRAAEGRPTRSPSETHPPCSAKDPLTSENESTDTTGSILDEMGKLGKRRKDTVGRIVTDTNALAELDTRLATAAQDLSTSLRSSSLAPDGESILDEIGRLSGQRKAAKTRLAMDTRALLEIDARLAVLAEALSQSLRPPG